MAAAAAAAESKYVDELTHSLFALQQKELLCDVTVTVDDGKMLAHSAVLAAASEFICGQLQQLDTTGHRTEYNVHLPGCSVAMLSVVLRLIYTGVVHLRDPADMQTVFTVCTSLGINMQNLRNVSVTIEAAPSPSSTQIMYVVLLHALTVCCRYSLHSVVQWHTPTKLRNDSMLLCRHAQSLWP